MPGPRNAPGNSRWNRRVSLSFKFVFATALTTVLVVLGLEVLFRLLPSTMPESYRATLPLGGLDRRYPGILTRTGIDEVPLPHILAGDTVRIDPPQSLKALGVAPKAARIDRDRFGKLMARIDAWGFPNSETPERADVFLVGDSFALYAGLEEPSGLRLFAMARYDHEVAFESADTFYRAAIENEEALEHLLATTCSEAGIEFLSTTAYIRDVAAKGELAYLAADIHWAPPGQLAFLEPLLELLARHGVEVSSRR